MSENIICVLDFIINSEKLSTDSFFFSLFSWNGMGTKDCGWLKVMEDTSHASFKLKLNEGRKTKAVFQGSFRLRWPSATFGDVAAEKCSLCGMQPSVWETPHINMQYRKSWRKKTRIKCIYKKINALPKSPKPLKRRQNNFLDCCTQAFMFTVARYQELKSPNQGFSASVANCFQMKVAKTGS